MTEPPRPDLPPFSPGQAPNLPYAPPVPDQLAAPPQRPRMLDLSIIFWFVAAAWWYLAAVIGGFTHLVQYTYTYTYTQSTQTGPNTSTQYAQTQVHAVPMGLVIVGATVVLGLWIGLIFLVRSGANWARIVLTVIAGLAELGELIQIFSSWESRSARTAVGGLLDLVLFLLVLIALILMYQPQSNWFFRRR